MSWEPHLPLQIARRLALRVYCVFEASAAKCLVKNGIVDKCPTRLFL